MKLYSKYSIILFGGLMRETAIIAKGDNKEHPQKIFWALETTT